MNKRYIYISIIAIIMTGCMPKVQMPDINNTKVEEAPKPKFGPTRTFNPNIDEKYKLKPEPYSLASKEKDPELLGPQSTLKNNPLKDSSDEEIETEDYDTNKKSSKAQIISEVYDNDKSSKKSQSVTKSECISMLGLAKFNEYAKKYGGEGAALRRCAILKRLN